MLRSFLFFLLFIFCINATAQHMKMSSFKLLPRDMETRFEQKKTPDGEPCVLIRVVTPYKNFQFDFHAAPLCLVENDKKIAEVWVWVRYDARRFEIQHKELGVLRGRLPIRLEPDNTYEMVLTTDKIITRVEEAAPGFLSVKTTPQGAEVYINGSKIGETPLEKPLSIDTYNLKIKKKGYEILEKSILIKSEETITLEETLNSLHGILNIKTQPSGAKIFIDGEDTGLTTPAKKELLEGNYKVTLEKELFEKIDFNIGITKNETLNLDKKLISVAGTVKIITTEGATIKIDNKFAGISSIEEQLLPAMYFIVIEKAGYFPIKKMITLHKGKTTTLDLPLRKKEGILILTTKPSGANVYVDGDKIGKTPMSKKIIEGKRRIKIEKEGYETIFKNYDIEYNKKITKNIVLDKATTYSPPKKNYESLADENNDIKKNNVVFNWGISLTAGISFQGEEDKTKNKTDHDTPLHTRNDFLLSRSSTKEEREKEKEKNMIYGAGIFMDLNFGFIGIRTEANYIATNEINLKGVQKTYKVNMKKLDIPVMLSIGKKARFSAGINNQYITDMVSIETDYQIKTSDKWFVGWLFDIGLYLKQGGISMRAYNMEGNIFGSFHLHFNF